MSGNPESVRKTLDARLSLPQQVVSGEHFGHDDIYNLKDRKNKIIIVYQHPPLKGGAYLSTLPLEGRAREGVIIDLINRL